MQQVAPSTRKLMKIAESALAKGRGQEAWDAFQQVLKINPHHLGALYQSGFMLHSAGHYQQAEQCYRVATQVDPEHFPSHQEILRIMEAQGRGADALGYAKNLVQRMPENKKVHLEMIRQMMRFNHVHLVPVYADEVLQRFPNDEEVLLYQALALQITGQYDEADAIYRPIKTRSYKKIPLQIQLSYELFLPRTYHSTQHIEEWRYKFSEAVESFIASKIRDSIDAFHHMPLFQLAFHNHDNKEILQRYARMLRAIDPTLTYIAPHCKSYQKPQGRKLRIGFISRFMHKHSVGNCYRDIMIHLGNQPDMEVTLFNPANVMDEKIQEILNSNVKLVILPKMLEPSRKAIADYQPDLIFFPDIGMDATTHYLAMARLAPIQVCLNGHPETTGIDTMDYFFSPRYLEPAQAQQNYTETLLCFEGLDALFKRAASPARWKTREELKLPVDKKLYIFPMAIQKFHPDFDAILAGILEKDPEAQLVLFNDFQQQTASDIVRERITQRCDPARVTFLQWLPLEDLFSVMKTADALLDTIYFGGGTTIMYAFAFGIPVVTMPSNYVRGRVVHCMYEFMGIKDAPSGNSPEAYVDIAVKLAHTPSYRAQLEQQILAANPMIFDHAPGGETYARFVRDAVRGELDAYRHA